MSKRFTKLDVGVVKSLNKLTKYDFPKDKYWCDTKGTVYIKDKDNMYTKMSPYVNRDGYVEYVLTEVGGKKRHIQGQRIVAILYIPNPKNLPHVNHEDGVRDNNNLTNLNWSTISDNIKHSYRVLRKKK